MQSKLLFISIVVSGLCSFSVKNGEAFTSIESKDWAKSWAKVKEGTWMQKTEVSNAEFRLFLDDLKAIGNLDGYHSYYPDTLGWQAANAANKPLDAFYFSSPSFDNYPVVNISYEAAEAYCYWLGAKYNALNNQPFGKVKFSLPSQEEWILAARSGKNDNSIFPWKGEELTNKKGEKLSNFKSSDFPQGSAVTAPVNSFYANSIGLYNVVGNVAEMVKEKGVAMGGSYMDSRDKVGINSRKQYATSTADIGFRVMMTQAK